MNRNEYRSKYEVVESKKTENGILERYRRPDDSEVEIHWRDDGLVATSIVYYPGGKSIEKGIVSELGKWLDEQIEQCIAVFRTRMQYPLDWVGRKTAFEDVKRYLDEEIERLEEVMEEEE